MTMRKIFRMGGRGSGRKPAEIIRSKGGNDIIDLIVPFFLPSMVEVSQFPTGGHAVLPLWPVGKATY